MTRLSAPTLVRKPAPDIYTLLLLVGCMFLLAGIIICCWDLMANYGLKLGQLFTNVSAVPK